MTVRSFFSGLWRGLDALRKVLHLIVLLVILAIVVGALRGAVPRIPSRAALLVAPARTRRVLLLARVLLERHARRIVLDLNDFGVPGLAAANRPIVWLRD